MPFALTLEKIDKKISYWHDFAEMIFSSSKIYLTTLKIFIVKLTEIYYIWRFLI